jgi:preprotein translocase SecE subunit
MARDRQRAKQRQQQRREERLKARREAAAQGGQPGGDGAPPEAQAPTPPDVQPPTPPDVQPPTPPEPQPPVPPEDLGHPEPLDDEAAEELFLDEEDLAVDQDELAEAEGETGYAARGRRADRTAVGEPTRGGGIARVGHFLRACWAELQRVQWPDRAALTQLTAIVLVFIVIMGAYLGILDAIVSRVIQEIL